MRTPPEPSPPPMYPSTNKERRAVARLSLRGLSVGDAFGERFFDDPDIVADLIASRRLPDGPWHYTDDTQMAISIVRTLELHGEIDQEALARSFAQHYEPSRGYGAAMHDALARIRHGEPWPAVSRSLFGGQGSFGNGGAMRVAPAGAWFSGDLDAAVVQAARSAEVTHAHPEAVAGAIAVAVAAAWALRLRLEGGSPETLIERTLPYVPESKTRAGLVAAQELGRTAGVRTAVEALGNGSKLSAQDTVPFAIWCAAKHLDDFERALWETVSGLGDRDTNCAISGGIVSLYCGDEGVPVQWIERREPLPRWPQ